MKDPCSKFIRFVCSDIPVIALLLSPACLQAYTQDNSIDSGNRIYQAFSVLEDTNQIDDENPVDQPDELTAASETLHDMPSAELSKNPSNPDSPLPTLAAKQIYISRGDHS